MTFLDSITGDTIKTAFSKDYKEEAFLIWYRAGKPNLNELRRLLPPDELGRKPTRTSLEKWAEEFEAKARPIDEAVREELNNRLIKEKIEMLERHSRMALELQEKALNYLRNVDDKDLGSAAAVRLLVEAIRIERTSRGVPQILEKMAAMSDDDLLKETEKLLLKSPIVEITPAGVSDDQEDEKVPDM